MKLDETDISNRDENLGNQIFSCLFLCLKSRSSGVEHVSGDMLAGARDVLTWGHEDTWEHLSHVDQCHNEA